MGKARCGALRQKETERKGVCTNARGLLVAGSGDTNESLRRGEAVACAWMALMQSNCMKWMEDALLGQVALLALQF